MGCVGIMRVPADVCGFYEPFNCITWRWLLKVFQNIGGISKSAPKHLGTLSLMWV